MIKRIIYTISMLRTYRHAISDVFQATPAHYQTIQINPQQLKQLGVSILVLDFDGVLAPHGDLQPLQELQKWLEQCVQIFGENNIFILSNKPMPQRIAYFKQSYAGIRFIVAVKKKPYPDGLEQIITLTGKPSTDIMLVDDRLLTGVLAACIANVQITYITYPYTSIKQRPIAELFFMSLRGLERSLFRIIK
ncbi:HAD family hydrolase [Candidatus Albibeggiatoa sp. nov. BB20]|uniref:YqeG family HAD IIIA-type phosphatase n=1 Tax=Candidatus Albibeggiatoa sp. nov. BB20 TaxID=3162723 RepID=UPI0033659A84